jgi:hypothetical protein
MFKGVIKNNSRKILMDLLRNKPLENVYVGCSGAFTIEMLILRNLKPKAIFSSDVSMFTNAIGYFLTDRDYSIEISDLRPEYHFLRQYIDRGLEYKTAVVLYLQDISDYVNHKNYYVSRMYENYLISYKEIIEQKVLRLHEQKDYIKSKKVPFYYQGEDVIDFVERCKKGDLFIAFPPFFKGGYEKQYTFIGETLIAPELHTKYKMFTDTSLLSMVGILQYKEADYVIVTNKGAFFQNDPKVYCVGYDYFTQTEMVTFISNFKTDTKFAKIDSSFVAKTYGVKIASKEDLLTINLNTNIDIREIPLDLFDSIRLSRLSHKIKKYPSPMIKFGVFAEDKIIGIFGVNLIEIKGKRDYYYLLSDLPVENVGDVAKLIAALSACSSVREYIRKKYVFDFDFIKTTAFTDKPVSMKYRNFWKVANRGKDRETGMQFINYVTEMGKLHKKDILQKWLSIRKVDR